MKQSDVLIRPYVTEKSMNHMSGTPTQKYKDGNRSRSRRSGSGSRKTESTPSSNWPTATPQRMSDPGSEYSEGE